ncbi:MAG TPA: PQQ-binding-like beta-propeller repeat protein [Solirubrobacterales bacterium]|nr:PQQ-binding-like beta-propeller repeat protein [Solirubrobacterales bacterium]
MTPSRRQRDHEPWPTGPAPWAIALMALAVALFVAAVVIALAGCGSTAGSDAGTEAADAPLVDWPVFGRVPERTHYLPTDRRALDPPLREAWSINTHGLIEFPPAVANGVAYVVNKYGNLAAVRLRDHKVLWRRVRDARDKGKPTDVTAPVYYGGRVYVAFLDGELVALDAATGRPAWKRDLRSHLESSPIAVDGTLYIGTDKTDVVALRAGDGAVRWRFNSPGAIKASPSHHDGRVYVADYESAMFCLDADTGKLLWRTNTSRVRPFGRGGFYSSPAIAFGSVYAARDDGTVYAFDQDSGKVEWFFRTGDYVYGSPAVARVPGTPPTVYIGSYDKRLYAIDARSGKERWDFDVGGPVPGTATVIGHTVYTSSFKTREAIGVDVRTRRKTFELREAGYTPAVSDGRRLYLVGYFELIGLEPKRR